jgi:hypothetical protein
VRKAATCARGELRTIEMLQKKQWKWANSSGESQAANEQCVRSLFFGLWQ